ncbi:hypothetical protein ACFPZ0_03345 [Streptomonospora nanhaiensis]|uniref:Uncharacterized protein n=1 Tax=Streptomonospora nanhaiensis TaxID=1323731 RepID=A0A853BVG2_9ACTN|nr:hypothetical protein [Streptomonospora nanhaiensis]MBV2364832.1 hypothetical protein [Streptomonospora nanhaiensis]MBX9387200.1 hypothetical protein [Streptomonospora nanhaiensis]NYI98776.1 hypothetical protein [Streptomonospora nanhaiensis]
MSPTDPAPPDDPGPPRQRHGILAWTVFVAAIAAVLTLITGCLSVLYGPLITGG